MWRFARSPFAFPRTRVSRASARFINSLSTRIRNKFNVSIAEVGDNDSWQLSTLGITCVSNNSRHAEEVLSTVLAYMEGSREDVELVGHEQEIMTGF